MNSDSDTRRMVETRSGSMRSTGSAARRDRPNLKLVPPLPNTIHAYESKERQRIASKNWAHLHIHGDKQPPLDMADRVKRGWLR